MMFDAAQLYNYFVRGDPGHWAMVGQVELVDRSEELAVSPFVLVELAGGAWTIAAVDLTAMRAHVAAGATLASASLRCGS